MYVGLLGYLTTLF